jgi:hypothetical protein
VLDSQRKRDAQRERDLALEKIKMELQAQGYNPYGGKQQTEDTIRAEIGMAPRTDMNRKVVDVGKQQFYKDESRFTPTYTLSDEGLPTITGKIPNEAKYVKPDLSKEKIAINDMKFAQKLRQEYTANPINKQFNELSRQYKIMDEALNEALSKGNTESKAFADQALIVTFNKILDPASVVREGEYARTPEGLSAMNRIQGYVEKLRQGGVGLTDNDRRNALEMAKKLIKSANDKYKTNRNYYKNIAIQSGVEPELIIGDDYSLNFNETNSQNTSNRKFTILGVE